MTWLELYNFLHSKANNVSNLDSKIWNENIIVHNRETGEEHECYIVITEGDQEKSHILAFNNN